MANLVFAGAGNVFPRTVRTVNMLSPTRWKYASETGAEPNVRNYIKADYFKDWLPFNLQLYFSGGTDTDTTTFGDFTTAPDGTTDTARLIRETATNTEHSIVAGIPGEMNFVFGKVRFAGVFKYAGRRIVMTIQAGTNVPYGCKAVFDLLHGTVAVQTEVFGAFGGGELLPIGMPTAWVLYPAQIQPVGNGWFLCSIEVQPKITRAGSIGVLWCKVSLDNGVGSFEHSTYLGDGSSGVYAWRANMLPSRAWDIQGIIFEDDFDDDTMSQIDFGNTLAPGFKWYLNGPTPQWDSDGYYHQPDPPSCFSCSDSVLRIAGARNKALHTFRSTWVRPPTANPEFADPEVPGDWPRNYTHGYVGGGFVAPFFLEGRTAYDTNDTRGNDGAGFWGVNVEMLCWGKHEPAADPPIHGREAVFYETRYGKLFEFNLHHHASPFSPGATIIANPPSTWSEVFIYGDNIPYNAGYHVEHLGEYYTCLITHGGHFGGPGTNDPKPPNLYPDYWGPFTSLRSGVRSPTFDVRILHDTQVLWLPWTADQPGQIYEFHNGILNAIPLCYGPEYPSILNSWTDKYHLTDWTQQPIMLGNTETYYQDIDWVRVSR